MSHAREHELHSRNDGDDDHVLDVDTIRPRGLGQSLKVTKLASLVSSPVALRTRLITSITATPVFIHSN